MSDELAFAPALEQAELVRLGKVSPVELVEMYLRRADELNPEINAYITIAHDQARAAARRAQELVGADDLPPFHGVPISIKDLSSTAGIRTTMGSGYLKDNVPAADDRVVALLRNAGFVIVGKSNTPEMGIGSTDPVAYGPCRNPWRLETTTRGSSGGAAAALAAGLCAISHASDGGGSVRLPAATCGAVGLKPSRGRISAAPRNNDLFVQPGPIARTVRDAAAYLDVVAGPVSGDAFWAPPPARPFLDACDEEPARLRVAFLTHAMGSDTHPSYVQAVRDVARLLENLGHDVSEDAPAWPDPESWVRFLSVYSARLVAGEDLLPPDDALDPIVRGLLRNARTVSLKDYLQGEAGFFEIARRIVTFFDDYDVLVTPTVARPARLVTELRDADGNMAPDNTTGPFCFLWNVTGQPAITLPLAIDTEGLPIGIQLVGRPQDEAGLFRLAAQLEAARPWIDRIPPIADPKKGKP